MAAADVQNESPETDEPDEDVDGQTAFPMGALEGDAITLGKLVKASESVGVEVSMSKAAVPVSSGGLLNPRRQGRVLVTYLPGKVEEVPHRVDGEIDRWTFRQHLQPIFVSPANDEATLIRAEMANLAQTDQVRAQALLAELAAIVKDPAAATA